MDKNKTVAAALLISLISLPAFSSVATIDPNLFAGGAVITDPGATLSTETVKLVGTDPSGNSLYAPVVSGPVFSFDVGPGCTFGATVCAVDGQHLFAPSAAPVTPAGFGPGEFWTAGNDNGTLSCLVHCLFVNNPTVSLLRVDFSHPTNFVNVLGFNQGGDPTFVSAFDAAGNVVGSAFVTAGGSGFGWGDATILDSGADISSILIGGANDTFRPINEIEYNRTGAVPLPEEAWVMLTGMVLVGLFHFRRALLPARSRRNQKRR